MIKVFMFFLPLALFFQTGAFAQNATLAGTVIATQGKVTAVGADRARRVLVRGEQIFEKDTILVDKAAKVQIKFTDGALLNLIEQTEYKIEAYSYKNKGRKDESVGDLVKGGFRSLSGGISKTGENASMVKTPVGTMGVRGTLMSCRMLRGTVYFGCEKGLVRLVTAGRFRPVKAGRYGTGAERAVNSDTENGLIRLSKVSDLSLKVDSNNTGSTAVLIGDGQATQYASSSSANGPFQPLSERPGALAPEVFVGPAGSVSLDGTGTSGTFQDDTEVDWDAGEC